MNAIVDKLSELNGRGISVTVSPSHTLQVSPGRLLSNDDRDWLRVHSGAILSYLGKTKRDTTSIQLSGNEPWDSSVAHRLMQDADSLVQRLGVGGTHPEIVNAAAMVCSAYTTRDAETLRFAVGEFCLSVRQLASQQPKREQRSATHDNPGGLA